MRNDAGVKRGAELVKTKPTSRVCRFQLISCGMPWRRWCSGIMQDSHSCDPGSIPGRRTCILSLRVCEASCIIVLRLFCTRVPAWPNG